MAKVIKQPAFLSSLVKSEKTDEITSVPTYVAMIEQNESASNDIKLENAKSDDKFFSKIISKYNIYETKDSKKTTIALSAMLLKRLKVLALSGDTTIVSLSNAIILDFLEKNKDKIDELSKNL